MEMSRRELLTAGALGGVAIAAGLASSGAEASVEDTGLVGRAKGKPAKAVLKIASQEGRIPGKDLPEKLAKMEKWDIDGIEFGGGNLQSRVPEIKAALANSKLKIAAICAGFQGALMSDDPAVRQKCADSMKVILTAAGELGSTGLIFVPAFNGQTKLDHIEGRKILLDQLPDLAEFASKAGTRLLLEPLNRKETWYVRLVADAASICRDVNHRAACVMGDFYHMYIEETSDMGAFISGGNLLHHVHLASIKRNLPGQDERDYTNGFKGLKMIGYQDFCSFECGCIGDAEVEIPKSVQFLRGQWKKA
jgi:sugar phosphate isomerase/epimerase